MKTEQKSAFIAIVGCPNVGKSSIMNKLLGQKVAIVSPKPQTTRTKIMGVLTEDGIQLVFTDTPGIHKPKTKLGENMVRAVSESMSDIDACLMVVEPFGELREEEKELLERFRREKTTVILAINKIDLLQDKAALLERIALFSSLYDFSSIIPLSARDMSGMNELKKELVALAVPYEHFFPEDTLTDQPERVLVAEMVREKLLRLLDKEIPHGIAVFTESFKERADSDIIDIEVVIYCEKETHKGIIIGKGGEMLKTVSTRARQDMEKMFECRVNLKCWVKVKADWRNREALIRDFGLE